jgi:hypothetical protein
MRTQDRRGSETTKKKSQPMSAWLPELRHHSAQLISVFGIAPSVRIFRKIAEPCRRDSRGAEENQSLVHSLFEWLRSRPWGFPPDAAAVRAGPFTIRPALSMFCSALHPAARCPDLPKVL